MRRDRRHLLSPRRWLIAGLLALALALRVAFVLATPYHAVNDAGTYNRFAASVATDGDYTTGDDGPGTGAGGSRGPTAYFPPAFPYALSLADLLDGHTGGGRGALTGERIETAALGTVAVGLVGLLALQLAGPGPGLAALGLAALYPPWIELSGTLAAEDLLVVLELAALCAVLRARGSPHPWRWVALGGGLVGLATLAHENAALMLLPLAVGAALAPGRGGRRAAGAVLLLCVAAAALVSPWTVRNALQLHHFVPVSDETGITLRGAYNPVSAADRAVPWKWRLFWSIPADHGLRRHAGEHSEIGLSGILEHQALRFIADHPDAPLQVGWHNLRRMAELEGSAAWQDSARAMDLPIHDARIGVIGFWVVGVLALGGLLTRPARRIPWWVWGVPVLFVLSVVFVNVETPRFREPVDPFLLLLAGCALSNAAGHVRRSRS